MDLWGWKDQVSKTLFLQRAGSVAEKPAPCFAEATFLVATQTPVLLKPPNQRYPVDQSGVFGRNQGGTARVCSRPCKPFVV